MILQLRLYRLFLSLLTYSLPILCYPISWWLWAATCAALDRPVLYAPHSHTIQILFGVLVWGFAAEHYRVTTTDEVFRERTGARNAWSASVTTFFLLLVILFFTRNDTFPRGLLVWSVVLLFTSTLFLHAAFRAVCRSRTYLAKPIRLLVVGADEFAVTVANRLQRLSFARYEIVGFVRLPNQNVGVSDCRNYDFAELGSLRSSDGIDEAVIAIHPAEFSRMPDIIAGLNRLCLPARAVVDLGESIVVREKLFQLGHMQMLDLTSTPTESLDYALLKRVFDVAFSLIVLLLMSPLFGLIALFIKLTSPGPVFFTQERVGLNGSPFRMYKFRSMRVGAQSDGDTVWTTSGDPRRTALGKILRKTSLDELPQFINVLKGDMSVVGPRPERPHFVHQFLQDITRYNHRHALKVGITGWAQVNGWRGDTSIEKRVEYDLYYVQNWSFLFDLRIIAMTVASGLIAKHAY
jgi:Undecaprenyl-phosphate glucose phosphotransferase